MKHEDTIQRTWIVNAETARRINALAERLGVSPSALVERLLAHGLDAADDGVIPLAVRPVRYELA